MGIRIDHADVREWAVAYDGPLFHALLCDPPYHLTSIVRRFGAAGAAPAQPGTDGAFQRASRGFMNQTWDGGDLAFDPALWGALWPLLHPGAFGMAFASSRGWHRMAVAIEDAGYIIHPTIFNWVFASGFPKATRIDTAADRREGAEPRVVGQRQQGGAKFPHTAALIDNGGFNDPGRESFDVTEPGSELGRDWRGHRYGMQALKPAVEPIIVFQKPYAGRPTDNILDTGAGALNIDAGRVNPGEVVPGGGRSWGASAGVHEGWRRPAHQSYQPSKTHDDGRWPANFTLQHTPVCTAAVCDAACPARRLAEQGGERPAGHAGPKSNRAPIGYGGSRQPFVTEGHGDSGTAARFFHQSSWAYEVEEQINGADAVCYEPKASSSERDAGLSHLPPITVGDGRQTPIDNAYQRGETTRRNPHPTVKPIALNRWLASLLLPPARYAPRRILVPFAGVASEAIGAWLAGWDEVLGVELTEAYVPIAEARVRYWMSRGQGYQLPLFDEAA